MNDDELNMLDYCLDDDSDRMSQWEVNFIDDLDRRWRWRPLSDSQRDRLEEIYLKLTE